jgi:hypothetical protein
MVEVIGKQPHVRVRTMSVETVRLVWVEGRGAACQRNILFVAWPGARKLMPISLVTETLSIKVRLPATRPAIQNTAKPMWWYRVANPRVKRR